MKTIRAYYNDPNSNPKAKEQTPSSSTDVELELFAQTWSEHCNIKSLRATIIITMATVQNNTFTI